MQRKIIVICILWLSLLANVFFITQQHNKRELKKLFKTAMRQSGVQSANAPLCFYHKKDTIDEISFSPGTPDAKPLPACLIVPPGVYSFNGHTAVLNKEGLYRFIAPDDKDRQVIVYQHDLETLLSSVSWIITHGNKDNNLPYEEELSHAIEDKLYFTCWHTTSFCITLLQSLGYKARVARGMSLYGNTDYSNSHILLEVFHPELNKWILADIDNNTMFEDEQGSLLNLVDAKKAIDNNTVRFHYLSVDAFVDISGFTSHDGYSYAFYSETLKSQASMKKWLRSVLDVVFIDNYFYDTRDITRVKSESSDFIFIDKENFYAKFYPGQYTIAAIAK